MTADVIAVIEFQKVDRSGGQSGDCGFERTSKEGEEEEKKKKNRHVFVRDKRDSVPFSSSFFFFVS